MKRMILRQEFNKDFPRLMSLYQFSIDTMFFDNGLYGIRYCNHNGHKNYLYDGMVLI